MSCASLQQIQLYTSDGDGQTIRVVKLTSKEPLMRNGHAHESGVLELWAQRSSTRRLLVRDIIRRFFL